MCVPDIIVVHGTVQSCVRCTPPWQFMRAAVALMSVWHNVYVERHVSLPLSPTTCLNHVPPHPERGESVNTNVCDVAQPQGAPDGVGTNTTSLCCPLGGCTEERKNLRPLHVSKAESPRARNTMPRSCMTERAVTTPPLPAAECRSRTPAVSNSRSRWMKSSSSSLW